MTRPTSYRSLTARQWKLLVKAPDRTIGKGYQIWACITQFDAATGGDSFLAEASYKKEKYWFNGENAWFTGSEARLSDFVTDDQVLMSVVSTGAYSYDTQSGGNTTVPSFEVIKISHKASC